MSAESSSNLAVSFREFGTADVLEIVELSTPAPPTGGVVVEVVAAGVNPTDLAMRAGLQTALMSGAQPPYVPGMEFAGRIHAIGAEVADLAVGQPVMGIVDARRALGGAQARFVCVPRASVTALDGTSDLVLAGAVPLNGLTADLALDLLELSAGESVFITGGAGGLGGYAIQLAKVAGLTVIADAQPSDAELISQLGADVIVPRGDGMTEGVRAHSVAGVDGAIDAARIGSTVSDLVRDGGTFIGVRSTDASGDERVRRLYVSILEQLNNTPALHRLGTLVAAGRLTPRVSVRLPFTRAADAHRLIERGGLRGRIVLLANSSACPSSNEDPAAPEGDQ